MDRVVWLWAPSDVWVWTLRWFFNKCFKFSFFNWFRSISCFQLRIIDLFSKEQLKEEFVKINPRHTLPTLDDNGFILTESRAIAIYLVEKYFPDGHSLYPKDIKQRARIHELLLFDSSTLYPPIRTIIVKFTRIVNQHFSHIFVI